MPHRPRIEEPRRTLRRVMETVIAVGITLVIVGVVLVLHRTKKPSPALSMTATPVCAAWERTYAVIPGNAFPLGPVTLTGPDGKPRRIIAPILRVRQGETWVIKLAPGDTTGWVMLDPASPRSLSNPSGKVRVIYPDVFQVDDGPGKYIRTYRRFLRRYIGEDGCVLVSS